MAEKKPNCRDFILAAIEEIRRNPSNIKRGANAGVKLHRLWNIAQSIFTEKEFIDTLNSLLKDETLLVAWKVRNQRGKNRFEKVTWLPDSIPLKNERWHRQKEVSKRSDPTQSEVVHETVHDIKVYIVADGLPIKVLKIGKVEEYSLAVAIAAKLQNN